MKKYRLVSEYGNRVVYTDSEKEKDQLLKRGFYIQEAQPPKVKAAAPTAKKRKAVKKNEGKAEDKDRS